MKVEVGKIYVIKILDNKNVNILHEYSKKESFMYNIYSMAITVLKIFSVLISVVIPPLLFITILLLKKNKI